MQWNAYFKELSDYEKEIHTKWYWKFRTKKTKQRLLTQIAFEKSMLSRTTKTFDCMQHTAENS